MQFAEQLRTLVNGDPFEYEGDRFPVTISLGVHTLEGSHTGPPPDPVEFIKGADTNLYKAKRSGRNCVIG